MTIVIQHKYWGLEVTDEAFEITLSFNGQGQHLYIPFQALTSFLDPSVQFGLQFGQQDGQQDGGASTAATTSPDNEPEAVSTTELAPLPAASENGDNVVTLDQFRKD